MDFMHLIAILIILGLIWTSAFYQLSVIAWTALIGAGLLLFSLAGWLTTTACIIFWISFLAVAAFANLNKLRQQYLIKPLLSYLQKQLPTISRTEREAIEAGDTWWEKELFCGRPQWEKLFSIPKPTLTTEEQAFLNNQVEQLCNMLNDWEVVHNEHNLPKKVWDYLKKEKFFGMVIPKEYGGLGFSALMHSTVIMKIATHCISAAVTSMVPNSLGPGELIHRYGTEEQKKHFLPRLAYGEEIPCFALTAPEAGSDAGSIPDIGIVCYETFEGKKTLGMRLTWDKRYITLAPIATLLGLAIHLYDPDQILGEKEDLGITLCLIPTSHPGVEIGHRHYPMQLAFLNGPTRGKDVFIPMEWIIGGNKMIGQGWRMLMECLSIGRSISLPALSTACGKYAYRVTGAYAKIRRQFNTAIANFEGVEEALGYIAGYNYILEACRTMTAGAVDQHINPAIVSAIAKYQMTEFLRLITSYSMDVHAGQGIQVGPRNVMANTYLAVPISITVEGANILTRNLIIFGQGAIRCHPYLLKEIALISAEQPQIAELDRVLMAHVGFYLSNLLRNITFGLTGGKLIWVQDKNKRIKRHMRQLSRMSAALAILADTSLILLGGSLKRRERISARLGDIMSQLYLASTVLKYYHDQDQPNSDVDSVCWALQDCLHKIQIACDELFNNFPDRRIGKLLRWIIFPFGHAYHAPKDKLHSKVLANMLNPSDLRTRLLQSAYLSKDPENPVARLEKAFMQVDSIEPLLKKLNKAHFSKRFSFIERVNMAAHANILTKEEAAMLIDYETLKHEIITVDEFSFDLKKVIV